MIYERRVARYVGATENLQGDQETRIQILFFQEFQSKSATEWDAGQSGCPAQTGAGNTLANGKTFPL
jgi:hypothetical protein